MREAETRPSAVMIFLKRRSESTCMLALVQECSKGRTEQFRSTETGRYNTPHYLLLGCSITSVDPSLFSSDSSLPLLSDCVWKHREKIKLCISIDAEVQLLQRT